MEPESETVIDVQAEQIDSSPPESIDRWYTAAQVQGALNLNKAALQKAIAKLTSIYEIDLKALRRGCARATEYSQMAMDAIELLNAQKFSELRKLVEKSAPKNPEPASSAIVFVDRHHQIANTAATAADGNLAQIASLKSGLLDSWRQLGRASGRQAAAEFRQGFTEEVRAGLSDLQEA